MSIPGPNHEPFEVIQADDRWAAAWDTFVQANPDASFYHSFAWKHINENALGHRAYYLAAVCNQAITGIFPLVLVRSRLFGRILCSMPFVNYGGPCADSQAAADLLVREAMAIADVNRANYLEVRSVRPVGFDLPTALHKVSMSIALQPDPEVLWSAFTSKHRTSVRRAYKNDLRIVAGQLDQLNAFYRVLAEMWRAHGTPIYAKTYFAEILHAFPAHSRIYVVYHNDEPVAAAFNGHHNGIVEGLWAGTRPRLAHLQANYVLYWEMIKRACEEGFRTYHLGRSSVDSGGEFFKKKWNGEAKQLYWQYYLPGGGEMPQLNVNNPKYWLAIGLWRKLPIKLTTLFGPSVANYIP